MKCARARARTHILARPPLNGFNSQRKAPLAEHLLRCLSQFAELLYASGPASVAHTICGCRVFPACWPGSEPDSEVLSDSDSESTQCLSALAKLEQMCVFGKSLLHASTTVTVSPGQPEDLRLHHPSPK